MDKLYYVVLVVELQAGTDGKSVPFISYKYPATFDQDTFSASVTQFCFPDINQFPTEVMPREAFSFVLTEGDGERRFGYCLRKLPPGRGPRYPVGFSIMAYFPCFELYTKILDRVAHHYYESSMGELTEFVQSILQHKFPKPGDTFEVTIRTQFATSPVRFTRPKDNDSLLAHIELDTLLTHLDERNILIIFVSLVIERRIIFCSSALSVLSSCIQTAIALLYPLTWQHIYIPVLPKSLLSFVCAPMPFVVGVLKTELDEVLNSPMDEVLIVDLDDNYFIRTPGANPTDDLDLLPPAYTDNIRKCLRATTKMIKRVQRRKKERRSDADDLAEKQLNYELTRQKNTLTDAFIQFFIKIIGSYRTHLNNNIFDKEGFVNAQPAELRSFLEMLIGAQMFERFIQESSSGVAEGFDKRIEHAAKLAEMASGSGDREDLSKRPSTKKVFGWSTLRGNSKKEQNISIGAPTSIAIGAPTLIKATSEREGKEVKPNIPPKLSHPPPPKFIVPIGKSLPLAPGKTAPTLVAPSSPKPSPPPPVNRPLSSRPPPPGAGGPPGDRLSRQQSIPTHVYLQQKKQQHLPPPTSEDDGSSRLKRQSLNGIAPMNEMGQMDDPNWNKRHSVVVRGRGRGRGGPEIGDRVRPVSVRPGSLQPYTDLADLRSSDGLIRPPQRSLEGGPPRPPPRTPPPGGAPQPHPGAPPNAGGPPGAPPKNPNECGSPLTPGRRPMPIRKGRGEAPPSPAN